MNIDKLIENTVKILNESDWGDERASDWDMAIHDLMKNYQGIFPVMMPILTIIRDKKLQDEAIEEIEQAVKDSKEMKTNVDGGFANAVMHVLKAK